MNRILIVILILFQLKVQCQGLEYAWSNAFGSQSLFTEANFMAVDHHGNVYTVGAFSGTSDFDQGPGTATLSNSTLAHYIRKTDSTGAFLWVKKFGGNTTQNIRSIAADSQGNLFLSGNANAGIDLDPGSGSLVLNTPNNNFIIKLNTNGDLMWSRIDSTKFSTSYQSLFIDAGDNLYASGYYMGGYDFDKSPGTYTLVNPPPGEKYVFVMKLDAGGNHLWSEALSNEPQAFFFTSLCADQHGNAYLSGSFSDPLTIDPGSSSQVYTSAGNYDAFLIKVDSTGTFAWAIQTGGTGEDQGSSVVCDMQGNVILAGAFTGTVDFDPGAGVHSISTPSAGFVQKLSGSGNYLWANTCPSWISSDQTDRRVATDLMGNIFVIGYVVGTQSFSPPSVITVASQGDRDVIVAKYDTNGTVKWAGLIGGEFVDQPYAIITGPWGKVYAAGAFSSLYADLNPDSTIVSASTGSAITSAFVVTFDQPCSTQVSLKLPTVSHFCSGESYFLQAQGATVIDWLWDGVFVNTGGNYETPPLTVGTHTVVVSERTQFCSGGKGDSETMIAAECTGINDLNIQNSLVVVPNPSQGFFQLRSDVDLQRVQVYNAGGIKLPALIYMEGTVTVDLFEYPPGMYLITGTTSDGIVFSRRVLKQ